MSESFFCVLQPERGGRKKPGNEANNDEMETEKAHFFPTKGKMESFFFFFAFLEPQQMNNNTRGSSSRLFCFWLCRPARRERVRK